MTRPPLILASASTARASLLRAAGVSFRTCPARIDEPAIRDRALAEGIAPATIASHLALAKALAIAAAHPDAMVLGSDQVLVHGPRLLSKPRDRAEARAQLRGLSGGRHELVSAAALVRGGATVWEHSQSVALTMRDLSDAFLDDYVGRAGDDVLSSVGAYHLEGLGAQLFTGVDGDYFTVLGLPLLAVLQALRDTGHLAS